MSLPNEYIELEYIQSSGTQIIDSGITNSINISFDITFEFPSIPSSTFGICGSNSWGGFFGRSYTDVWLDYNINDKKYYTTTQLSANTKYTAIANRNGIQVNDLPFSSIDDGNGYSGTFKIFKAYSYYSTMKLYGCKLYDNGTLVRDFLPSIRKTDLAIGLYDLVNEVFYGNSGSGVFTGKFKENPQPSSKPFDIVFFYPNGTIQYDVDKSWDYNEKKLFDTWEMLSNVQIVKQDEDTNVVAIYNQDGTTLRGAYTILNDGTIQQISDGVAIPNRVGSNKTKYVFDSNNNVLDLAKANLPNLQYNHKITFNINFDGEYKFEDFNLAQPIKFYSTKDNTLFNSILTGRKYEISQNSDVIQNATFTLGKVRTDLTSKLNKVR